MSDEIRLTHRDYVDWFFLAELYSIQRDKLEIILTEFWLSERLSIPQQTISRRLLSLENKEWITKKFGHNV